MVSTSLITPPILDVIQARIDAELHHAANMALQICETHLNYLLDLRLEDDREMNAALKMEAAKEIKGIKNRFKDIQMLLVSGNGHVVEASEDLAESDRVREAHRLGASQYVKKPYTLESIGMAVKTELDAN